MQDSDYLENRRAEARTDLRTTDELIKQVMEAWPDRDSDCDHEYWNLIGLLHHRADDSVMEASRQLLASGDSIRREVGAAILAQVHVGDESKRPLAEELVLAAFENEQVSGVLEAMGYALGHIKSAKSISALLKLKDHPASDVRLAVAIGLGGCEEERVIEALIELSRDDCEDVRDWATFGLGAQIDADTPAIREALAARLDDPDDDTRSEALVGLARRKDPRCLPAIRKRIKEGCFSDLLVDAIQELNDPAILSELESLPDAWWEESPAWRNLLDETIAELRENSLKPGSAR